MGLEVHFAWAQIPDETTWARLSPEAREATHKLVDKWVHDFHWNERTANTWSVTLRKVRHLFLRLTRRGRERHSRGIHRLDEWFHPDWKRQARKLQKEHSYSRVVAAYVFTSGFLDSFPASTRKILDCHDIFTCRNDITSNEKSKSWWYSIYKADERRGLLRANTILGIQHDETDFFTRLTQGKRSVFTVGHFTDIHPLGFPPEALNTFGYIASNSSVNLECLHWFLRDVWPLIRGQQPNAVFLIAGSVGNEIPEGAGVKPVGNVSSLSQFYSQVLFAINPIRLGTGLKIKTVEALSFGRSVVSTTCGSSGLDAFYGQGILLANSREEFAEGVISRLADPGSAMRDGSLATKTAESINTQSREALAQALGLDRSSLDR
ncbi:glycosyltransferase [Cyanobium sp. Lug-B]|uniref:glycosyltransferase n=1 Tax=Cyanobium sp. Lug-B TaxID=2823716 RepID=UPI0020CCEA2F|nr:glycosyltransferase [Cyanobium sp. Lug-B]MCP9796223.1 glycosyltransferase [Cyanobium sp. Lug-B]